MNAYNDIAYHGSDVAQAKFSIVALAFSVPILWLASSAGSRLEECKRF